MRTDRHYLYNPESRQTLWVGESYIKYLIEKNEAEFSHSSVYDGALHNFYNFRTDNE